MSLCKTGNALSAVLLTLVIGCADVTSGETDTDSDFREDSSDLLAQTIPVDWPDAGRRRGSTPPSRPTPAAPSAAPTTPTVPQEPGSTRITVPDPNGVYFADISANGPGCPAGSWNARLAPDGLAFTVTFARYELRINQADTQDRKSLQCSVVVRTHSPSGLSYAVSYFSYTGAVVLESGVKATINTFYDFSGGAITSVNGTTPLGAKSQTFTGPYNDDFLYANTVASTDYVFSPCGVPRNLLIQTTLATVNSKPKGSGYINLSAIDGRTSSITVRLVTRRCPR